MSFVSAAEHCTGSILIGLVVGTALLTTACPTAPAAPVAPSLTGASLMDPVQCRGCHLEAFTTWERSGHAQSATSPLFRAMLQRGEREASPDVTRACVRCHVPLAPQTTAAELDTLASNVRGVTCFACHGVDKIEQDHDNGLTYRDPQTVTLVGRPGATSPTGVHHVVGAGILDGKRIASVALCASCHQSNDAAYALDATGAQYRESVFANATWGTSCAGCHLVGADHSTFASYNPTGYRAIETVVAPELCVESIGGGVEVTVRLENFGAAHHFPAGGAHRRRTWIEVVAQRGALTLFSTGTIGGEESFEAAAENDVDLWSLHSVLKDANDDTVLFPWEAASKLERGLVAATGRAPLDPAYRDVHQTRTFFFVGPAPDSVRLRVHHRPISKALVDALIESEDLDAAANALVTTTTLAGSEVEWTPALGVRCVPAARGSAF